MKKLFIAIILLLWLFISANVESRSVNIITGNLKIGGCDENINEINADRNEVYGTSYSQQAGVNVCVLLTADCTGSLGTAYFYTDASSGNATAKVCVYTEGDSDTVADASDVGVDSGNAACASVSESGGAGWKSGAFSTGTVTSGSSYWLCTFVSSTEAWNTFHDNASTAYYNVDSGLYTTPPNNISALTNSSSPFGPLSLYVTIK